MAIVRLSRWGERRASLLQF